MNNLGSDFGTSYGYVDLGTGYKSSQGILLEQNEKSIAGALSGSESDVISEYELEPGKYYLKISLDVKTQVDERNPAALRKLNKYALYTTEFSPEFDLSDSELPEGFYGADLATITSEFASPAVSIVRPVEIVQMDSRGRLHSVDWSKVKWYGNIKLDGTCNRYDGSGYSLVNYTLPAQRNWSFTATNVALGSNIQNWSSYDQITSAPGIVLLRNKGSFTRYMANEQTGGTDTQYFSYNFSGHYNGLDIVTVATDASNNLGIYGLDCPGKEMMVVTKYGNTDDQGHSFGRDTTTYKVVEGFNPFTGYKSLMMQRIETASNGLHTVSYSSDYCSNANLNLTKLHFDTDRSQSYVDANFDWTKNGSNTGYFAVSKNKAVIQAAHTIINRKNAASAFIAVTLDSTGSISSIKQVHFQPSGGEIVEDTAPFSGTLSLNAAGRTISLNRAMALSPNSIDDVNTTLNITGIGNGSSISGLADGDSVHTAYLRDDYPVFIEGQPYFGITKGQLGFQKHGAEVTVTQGSFGLVETNQIIEESGDTIVDINRLNVYDGIQVIPIEVKNGTLSVTVSTNSRGVTSYSIGHLNLTDNTEFSIGNVTYKKAQTALYRYEYGQITGVYTLGKNASISSKELNGTAGWKNVTTLYEMNHNTSDYGLPMVNLADVAKRWMQDNRQGLAKETYDLVVDKYVANDTRKNPQGKLAAYTVAKTSDWQVQVGQVDCATGSYKAAENIAQHIHAVADSSVTGSNGDDVVNSANNGYVFIRGGQGNDTINLGKAYETIAFNLDSDGHNVVNGYSSRDNIMLENGSSFEVSLDTAGANVFLRSWDGNGSVKLMGMGKGQAVTINDETYYFGNGTLGRNKTKTTTGAAFTYQEGAHYYGNDSGKNTLNVTKLGSLSATEDRITLSLGWQMYYRNIDIVNASGSTKGIDVTASDNGLRFTGSAYDDVISCGTGKDYIICKAGQGNDTIRNFGVDDVLQVNGLTADSIAAINTYSGGPLNLTIQVGRNTNTITMENMGVSRLTYDAKTKTVKGC